ncbi:MAG: nuclear transport factor 2 family protein [Actinomycetota bacterium]|nr:nuclear transport factor 2 family protein [Actinomycetota bacterium]
MDPQRTSDELEIAGLLTTYATAMDTQDWWLYRSVFTDDARVDYTSAGAIAGTRDQVADWLCSGLGAAVAMTMHYITNIESDIDGDTATVRAMFYNPMRLTGSAELSYRGGYHHHELVRTADGWRSRSLCEESRWVQHPVWPQSDSDAGAAPPT